MAGSQITKKAFAIAMKQLMAEKPMEKIKIDDIVKLCDMNRQSFYYHFKDKYDLVNWIFYTEFVSDLQQMTDIKSWSLLEEICSFLYENKSFYANAMKVRGQNSFSEYFHEVTYELIQYYFEDYFDDTVNQSFSSIFVSDAFCASIVRWLLEGSKLEPKEYVKLLKSTMHSIAEIVPDIDENNR